MSYKTAWLVKHKLLQTMLLQIYDLYKQSTEGDNSGRRPGFTDMAERMKFDA